MLNDTQAHDRRSPYYFLFVHASEVFSGKILFSVARDDKDFSSIVLENNEFVTKTPLS